MRTEWAVLADAERARIFARVGGAGWQDINTLSRGTDHRNGNGNGSGREVRLPAGMEKLGLAVSMPSHNPDDFIDRLAHELRAARKRGDFDALILVATEDVLEELHTALDPATRRTLIAKATENLVGLPLREARRQLTRRF
ncbi:MAG TPA: host attachment protein [Gammaproteobacteria bacterium]